MDDELYLCQQFSDLYFNEDSNQELTEKELDSKAKIKEQKRLRKGQRYEMILEKRRLKRKVERQIRRAKTKGLSRTASTRTLPFTLEVCIDFEFTSKMTDKEVSKLVRQIGRVWGLQKKYVGLEITLCSPGENILAEGRRVLTGFDNYGWKISRGQRLVEICQKPLVYLSPDADLPPLLNVHEDEVYVIGGLVDETGVGSLSKKAGNCLNVMVCRLPIPEFMKRKDKGTFNVMLPVNLVVEILARVALTGQWESSLSSVLPARIGYESRKNT